MAEPAQKIENIEDLGKIGTIICEALTAGDVNAALKCYEPNATVVFTEGEIATGRDAIGKALVALTVNSPKLTYLSSEILEVGDLALIRHSWNLNGKNAEGVTVDENFEGKGVARQQANCEWLVAIDSPYNAD